MNKQEIPESERTCVNPIEDQRLEALRHYQEASSAVNHWSGFVEAAIKAYEPATPSLSGKQEIKSKEEAKHILDMITKRVWHKSECDESMLTAFPNRYIEVVVSEPASQFKPIEGKEKVYREALEKIAHPLKYLQEKAKEENAKIDGMAAMQLIKDATWLQSIAQEALNQ